MAENTQTKLDKNIFLSIGKFLQKNVVCSAIDIQHFLQVELDYVLLPLNTIREHLDILEVAGFIEKIGETYSPKYFYKIEKNTEIKFDQIPVKQWHREIGIEIMYGKDENNE